MNWDAVGGQVEQLGDGVTCQTEWNDGRCECVFNVFGDQVAVAYLDEHGAPKVDLCERLDLGVDAFKRTLVVWIFAWSRAEQMSVLWRLTPPQALAERMGQVAPLKV